MVSSFSSYGCCQTVHVAKVNMKEEEEGRKGKSMKQFNFQKINVLPVVAG